MSTLHECVAADDAERLAALISEGADLDAVDEEGRTALFLAVELMPSMLDQAMAPLRFLGAAVHLRLHPKASSEVIRLLLESGANPNKRAGSWRHTPSPLTMAARSGLSRIVEMLLAHGANVKYRQLVHKDGVFESDREWQENHGDGSHNLSALDEACGTLNWHTARVLVEAGADLSPPRSRLGDDFDVPPLFLAACWDQTDLVELMLEKGADVTYVANYPEFGYGDRHEFTVLHFAIREGFPTARTVRLLCDWGADVNALSWHFDWTTALHMAGERDAPDGVVSALVVAGADPWKLNFGGLKGGQTVSEAWQREDILLDSRPSMS